jgi:uncharacterized protein (DUF58 family)
MNVSSAITASSSVWHGPGAPDRAHRGFEWKVLLWSLVFPPKRHRISITIPGLFLMGVSMGIGTAAYNTASNILFITLSLLLACLLLSGLLSWFNFMGVSWRLPPAGPWRAGHETLVAVQVKNEKKWLPTYGLWFDFTTHPQPAALSARQERDMKVRDVLKAFEKSLVRGHVTLRERLEPAGAATIEWGYRPLRRGAAVLELAGVGSLFPFGFLRKNIGASLRQTVLVWPAQVEYQWRASVAAQSGVQQGRRTTRAGIGEDLLALRKYAQGDSHRLIHWKASARLGQLMVRQFAAENRDGYTLSLDATTGGWTHPEQFELLCSLAGTLAEDLFATGQLRGVSVNGQGVREIRKGRDVETFLDELAVLQTGQVVDGLPLPRDFETRGVTPPTLGNSRNVITFAPEGARGVTAYVDGNPTASA